MERSAARNKEKRLWERCWGSGERKLGCVFAEASSDNSAELRSKVSQTGLGGLFVVFFETVAGPHSRRERIPNGHQGFGARNRNLNYEHLTRGALSGCGSTYHFLKESKNRVVELVMIGAECLQLSRLVRKTRKSAQNPLSSAPCIRWRM